MAQAAADGQKRELEEMRNVNADARRNALQLQQHIDSLQAEVIDRGLLLTLDDVLFAGNSARLNNGGSARLDQLIGFLDDYPYRSAQIESSAVCKASAGYDALLSSAARSLWRAISPNEASPPPGYRPAPRRARRTTQTATPHACKGIGRSSSSSRMY